MKRDMQTILCEKLSDKEKMLEEAADLINLSLEAIVKIACNERCDFVNKELFCDDCPFGKYKIKAEAFLKNK